MQTKNLFSNSIKGWKVRFLPVIIATLLVIALFSGCTVGGLATTGPSTQFNSNANASATGPVAPLYDENTVTALYDRTIPALVEVDTVIQATSNSLIPLPFNTPFSAPRQMGQGSGFFIDNEGHILTNNHVIDNAQTVSVVLYNGKKVDATVVGNDPQNDLALIRVSTNTDDKIAYLTLGNSDNIRPGQMAIAMGNPYGLEGSITVGVISGTGRSLPGDNSRTIVNVIQTDAAINPGNSGGPLLNSNGEVIGINTAIEASGSNIGFAVPINTAKTKLPALMQGGQIKNPWLGIQGMPINQELAKTLNLPVESGVYVVAVMSGSPAELAGLKGSGADAQNNPQSGGDIITAIDGTQVTKTEDILSYLNGKKPGDKVSLSIYRGTQTMTLSVALGEWPDQTPTFGNR